MTPEFKNTIPDYAKDLKLNIGSVLQEDNSDLTQAQIYGIALASSFATRNKLLVDAVLNAAGEQLSDEIIQAAKSASSIMAMNNVYYRFVHLSEDQDFAKMPAGLRMNVLANPGISKIDFELYSTAVSAINGCGLCISSHNKALINAGVSKAAIQHAIKISAVIAGLAQVMNIEE